MEFLLSGKALTIISKDRFSKYRPVGWWQAEEYTKEEDRHSVAYGKGNILSHKSWLISHWALVAIATVAGSSVRIGLVSDTGSWDMKRAKEGRATSPPPSSTPFPPHFNSVLLALVCEPAGPPALHAFIHT